MQSRKGIQTVSLESLDGIERKKNFPLGTKFEAASKTVLENGKPAI